MWAEHLAVIYSATVFLMIGMDEREQVVTTIMAITLVFFSCVGTAPIIVNLMLVALFVLGLWQKDIDLPRRLAYRLRSSPG